MPSVKPKRKAPSPSPSVSGDSSPPSDPASPPPTKKSKRSKTDAGETTAIAVAEPTPKTFADLGIIEPLCEALADLNFARPTPIQAESIPLALSGRDLIGLAETGSGKTAAFALPILQDLLERPQPLFALVLAPTRELAFQTKQQFEALGSRISVRATTIVGGQDMTQQAIALQKKPHVVVATPGRLLDHLENTKGFSLKSLKYLVMDEADRLLDLEFEEILNKILRVLPRETRRTYLFSATMSGKVEQLQRASLRNPLRVDVVGRGLDGKKAEETTGEGKPKHSLVSTLVQRYLFIPHKFKDPYLLALLTGPFAGSSCIIFARTVIDTSRITHLLRALGLGAIPLHGQLSQSARLAALNKFKSHSRDILCATDVAARGLDIPSVDLVLNYDLPGDDTTYVHRVGRTARAGKSGVAISMVSQYDIEVFQRIEKAVGKKLEEYKGVTREDAMQLAEKVNEGQRIARRKVNEEQQKQKERGRGGRKAKKGGRDEMDQEEG